jgi:hypothetical protein
MDEAGNPWITGYPWIVIQGGSPLVHGEAGY